MVAARFKGDIDISSFGIFCAGFQCVSFSVQGAVDLMRTGSDDAAVLYDDGADQGIGMHIVSGPGCEADGHSHKLLILV